MQKTSTLFHYLIKQATMGTGTSPLSFLDILLLLVALSWVITLRDFCLSFHHFLQTCFAFISGVYRVFAGDSTTSNSQIVDNNEELMMRGEVEMVMEKLGFHCDPNEELGSSQLAVAFEEGPGLEEVKEAFQVFDKNKDGYIDASELNEVLLTLGHVVASEVECQKMIQVFDENGDGRIDFGEFIKLVENSFC